MSSINNILAKLEFAQIGRGVPDIHAAVKFLATTLGIAGFPEPEHVSAQDLDMTYYGKVVAAGWLSSIPTKRWALPPKSWALHRKDGKLLNTCSRLFLAVEYRS